MEHSNSLRYTGHLVRRAQQLHLALWNREVSLEISSVQYAALHVIAAQPGISQRELGSELSLDRSTIADLVDRMTRRGLLSQERSANDRRRKVLTVTAQGAQALAELTPAVDRVDELITGGLSTEERDQLRGLLRSMLAHGAAAGLLQE